MSNEHAIIKKLNEDLDFAVGALRYVKAKLAPNAPKSLVFEEKWVDNVMRVVELTKKVIADRKDALQHGRASQAECDLAKAIKVLG